jgi:hypothetical protein
VSRRKRGLVERVVFFAYRRAPVRRVVRALHGPRFPKKWVFVVGCYNSGTTLLHDLIGLHPDVATLPREGVRYTAELSRPEDYGWTRMWSECVDRIALAPQREPDRARTIVADWSPLFDSRRRVFLEKSISNLPRMEWLDLNFAHAYFVGIIRNPYAVAEGIRRHARPRPPVSDRFGDRYPIELPARQWLVANTMLMDRSQHVERFTLLRYEDLVTEPVVSLGKVFRFLEEPIPPMTFEAGALSVGGGHMPIAGTTNETSVARLTDDDLAAINAVVASHTERFGYLHAEQRRAG